MKNIELYIGAHLPRLRPCDVPQHYCHPSLIKYNDTYMWDTDLDSWCAKVEQLPKYRNRQYYKVSFWNENGDYVVSVILNSKGDVKTVVFPTFVGGM